MQPNGASSSRSLARLGGVFYVLMVLSGGLASLARRGLFVAGDAGTTAVHIMAHQRLYEIGFAGDLLVVAAYVAVVALFHRLLQPVSSTGALTASYFGLLGCAVQGFALIFYIAPPTLLGGAPYLGVFSIQNLQALAYMFLKLYSQAYGIAIVFFGFYCLLTGYLAYKSTFLPRVLGALMMVAGLSWLTFLQPAFATRYFPFVLAGAVGEGLFALWLLVKGVEEGRWKQMADAAESRL